MHSQNTNSKRFGINCQTAGGKAVGRRRTGNRQGCSNDPACHTGIRKMLQFHYVASFVDFLFFLLRHWPNELERR